MDLLGGYGSDGSDSDSSVGSPVVAPAKKVAAPLLAKGRPTEKETKPTAVKNKKGRKLISLQNVLPPHILEQLTKAVPDDSDDEGPGSEMTKNMKTKNKGAKGDKAKSSRPAKEGGGAAQSQDEGLVSFLADLSSAETAAPMLKFVSGAAKSNTGTNNTQKKQERPTGSTRLGEDLIMVETVSTVDDPEINDPHGNTDKRTDENKSKNAGRESECRTKEPTRSSRVGRVSVPAPRRLGVPRPRMSAAPPVSSSLTDPVRTEPMPKYPSFDQNPSEISHVSHNTNNTVASKKRSRKEMQKALRSGDFGKLDTVHGIQTIQREAHQGTYVPTEESTATSGTGIRVANVAMYNTKSGVEEVGTDVSDKAKGKNQINHLMASAASFEANQQLTHSQRLKTNRASAKRKYGW